MHAETLHASEPATAVTVRIPQHVVHRAFASETVVLNLATGKYYGVNPTGGRMLQILEHTPNIQDAAALLAEEFAVPLDQITHDLTQFCDELVKQGLLEISDGD